MDPAKAEGVLLRSTGPDARPREDVRSPDGLNRCPEDHAASSSRDGVVASRHPLANREEKTSLLRNKRRELPSQDLWKAILT